jgi:16S rRNA (cytosine1402-N4)-methyltransferase
LGISSFQLDDEARGFAFKSDGPLDMRMDQGAAGISAADMVNTFKEAELEKIIFEFGEERFARRIAAAIVMQRAQARITTTKSLADIILRALPKGYTRGRIHPATRTFQAIRIAVNGELDALAPGLEVCFRALKKGGRLCVIAFHSLEDRLVKNKFKSLGLEKEGIVLTKRPLVASDAECAANPRSRSAKMRGIERAG